MKIIAGLGNPGDQYRMTRHNMGFLVLDALADDAGITVQKKKFEALLGDGRIGAERVLLVKPQTFMNLSGQSVRQVIDFYQKTPEALIVIHDDLDLPFGTVRIKVGGATSTRKPRRTSSSCTTTWTCPSAPSASRSAGATEATKESARSWITSAAAPSPA